MRLVLSKPYHWRGYRCYCSLSLTSFQVQNVGKSHLRKKIHFVHSKGLVETFQEAAPMVSLPYTTSQPTHRKQSAGPHFFLCPTLDPLTSSMVCFLPGTSPLRAPVLCSLCLGMLLDIPMAPFFNPFNLTQMLPPKVSPTQTTLFKLKALHSSIHSS